MLGENNLKSCDHKNQQIFILDESFLCYKQNIFEGINLMLILTFNIFKYFLSNIFYWFLLLSDKYARLNSLISKDNHRVVFTFLGQVQSSLHASDKDYIYVYCIDNALYFMTWNAWTTSWKRIANFHWSIRKTDDLVRLVLTSKKVYSFKMDARFSF